MSTLMIWHAVKIHYVNIWVVAALATPCRRVNSTAVPCCLTDSTTVPCFRDISTAVPLLPNSSTTVLVVW